MGEGAVTGVARGTSSGTGGGSDDGNEDEALRGANSGVARSSVRVAVPHLVMDPVSSGPEGQVVLISWCPVG